MVIELSSRQKQIINVSINIISKRGLRELTMKNLSREIGISEPAIYRHYDSKQKILIAVLESFKHQNKLIDNNSTIEGENSFEFLKRTITMIINRLNNNPAMSAVIFSEETFQNESELSGMVISIMNSTIEYFTTLLEKCQKDGNYLICALPLGLKKELVLPDDWYQGKLNFSEAIYKINLETSLKEKIYETQLSDIVDIEIISENKISFFDRATASVYVLTY